MMPSDLTLWEYWLENKEMIAQNRKWKQSTLAQYSSMMKRLLESKPSIVDDPSIKSLSFADCLAALVAVRRADSDEAIQSKTFSGYLSLLRDIFHHAEMLKHAVSPFTKYTDTMLKRAESAAIRGKKQLPSTISNLYPSRMENEMREKLMKRRGKRRSLSLHEMQALLKLIKEHLYEDGRYIALAIILYTGLRPNECRALRWEDYHPIPGSSGSDKHYYFEIHHVLEPDNKEKNRPKTSNGFRNIPVHSELQRLLKNWKIHVYESTPHEEEKGSIGLPPRRKITVDEKMTGYICCKEQHYGEPCRYQDLANFAKDKLSSLIDKDLLQIDSQEMELAKSDKSPLYEKDENPTLYALRRNFWTWMTYATSCTKYEKLYVMGHEMKRDGINLRPHFATPDKLERIYQCMNQFLILPEHATKRQIQYPSMNDLNLFSVSTGEVGYIEIRVPYDAVIKPAKMRIVVRNIESGDFVEMKMLKPIDGKFKIDAKITLTEEQIPSHWRDTLLTESRNLLAAERVLLLTQKSESATTNTENSHANK